MRTLWLLFGCIFCKNIGCFHGVNQHIINVCSSKDPERLHYAYISSKAISLEIIWIKFQSRSNYLIWYIWNFRRHIADIFSQFNRLTSGSTVILVYIAVDILLTHRDTLLTHWDKKPPFRRRRDQMYFLDRKYMHFDKYFTEIYSQGSNWQYIITVSDKGLAPNRRHDIICANGGLVDWHIYNVYESPGFNELIICVQCFRR